jgi:L-amino acid N-acyltransferase YncA
LGICKVRARKDRIARRPGKMNVTYKRLAETDLQFVTELYNFYVKTSTATFHMHELSTDEMHELVFFENPKYCTFIISRDRDKCGYASIRYFSSREGYAGTAEVTIYLKPECTQKGIGSASIRHIENIAKTNGFHVLVASICAENVQSIRLFEKSGFIKCAHFHEVGKKFGRILDVVDYEKIIG